MNKKRIHSWQCRSYRLDAWLAETPHISLSESAEWTHAVHSMLAVKCLIEFMACYKYKSVKVIKDSGSNFVEDNIFIETIKKKSLTAGEMEKNSLQIYKWFKIIYERSLLTFLGRKLCRFLTAFIKSTEMLWLEEEFSQRKSGGCGLKLLSARKDVNTSFLYLDLNKICWIVFF